MIFFSHKYATSSWLAKNSYAAANNICTSVLLDYLLVDVLSVLVFKAFMFINVFIYDQKARYVKSMREMIFLST